MIWSVLYDAIMDSIKLLPFLFIVYILMEYLNKFAGLKTREAIRKAGSYGPLWGGILGALPQCGFSAAAASLYSGKLVTMGTVIAVFLSTSDEMLPIFISEKVNLLLILKILGLKIILGIIAGFIIDIIFKQKIKASTPRIMAGGSPRMRAVASNTDSNQIKLPSSVSMYTCDCANCQNPNSSVLKIAIIHTLQIFGFIFAVTLGLNFIVEIIGEDTLAAFLANKNIISVFLSALIGLIPNCAASVVITKLYLGNMLGFGAMMAGLLVGAGVGVLVLFRTNKNIKDNLKIVGSLYILGVAFGLILSLIWG